MRGLEQILRRVYATPKALVQRAAEFNGSLTNDNAALTKSR